MKVYEAIIESVLKPKKPIRVTWTKDKLLQVKKRLEEKNVPYVSKPYIRFKDTNLEQETMFIKDPHCNVLEIKTLKNPEHLFDSNVT